jgi:hypothetical protein
MRTLFRTLLAVTLAPALGLPDLALAAEASGAEGDTEIIIAVRRDARPFIWKDRDTGQYLGFFWDICTEAVQRAGYRFRVEEIKAIGRKDFLSTGTQDYDLLCDPTTITLKRLQNFIRKNGASHLVFSPIVFVSNGTSSRKAVQNGRRHGDSLAKVHRTRSVTA